MNDPLNRNRRGSFFGVVNGSQINRKAMIFSRLLPELRDFHWIRHKIRNLFWLLPEEITRADRIARPCSQLTRGTPTKTFSPFFFVGKCCKSWRYRMTCRLSNKFQLPKRRRHGVGHWRPSDLKNCIVRHLPPPAVPAALFSPIFMIFFPATVKVSRLTAVWNPRPLVQ